MKLINHTLLILSVILFTTVGLWAFIFNSQLQKQVKNTLDEGLENYKIVIIDKLKDDSLIVEQDFFLDNNYLAQKISERYALQVRDSYKDTLIYSELKNTKYQVRLLTTAFISTKGEYFELKIISHEIDKGNLVQKIVFSLVLLFLFLSVSTLLVNNFVLKKTWKPFYEVLKYLDDFRLDQSAYRELSETKIKEFTLLNASIQNLIKTNIDIFKSQKQFIENASHELQTPLAIGINKLELLADEESLSPEQTKKIGDLIGAFRRLSSLNKSLLLLSKIENKQFIQVEQINLDLVFQKVIQEFSDYTDFQDIRIDYRVKDQWFVQMNKDLAQIMVMNLVKNAIMHNIPEGELNICLNSSSFSIKNTSSEHRISEENLFKRFNKSKINTNSTGLGLAIVKAIVDVSDLTISYTYSETHKFEVKAIK